MKIHIQTLRGLLAFHSSFFLSVDVCKFFHHDLKLLNGVHKQLYIPTLINKKFVVLLTLEVGKDLGLHYRRLISALCVKRKSISNLVWDENS